MHVYVQLYTFHGSSCAWRVRVALQLLEVAPPTVELVPVSLGGGEQHAQHYRDINPLAQADM